MRTRSEVEERVKELLNEGKSTEQIAAALREKGVKGYRKEARDCPIARFLKEELGLLRCNVSATAIEGRYEDDGEFYMVTHGVEWRGFHNFLYEFDNGSLPEFDASVGGKDV